MEDHDRTLVVDAMNVIGSRPTGWWRDRDAAVRRFAARLDRYAEVTGADVVLVVDGHPVDGLPEGGCGRLRVRYAHSSDRDAADDRIVDLLDELTGPVTVVTADRELRVRAAGRGADPMGPRELLRRMDDAEA